jgi:BlaI family penicillinase repressor
MSKKKDAEIRLGRLEMQIMNVVWRLGNATVHEVRDILTKGKTPAYSTVLTMMRKLEQKGYLAHTVLERAYVYSAVIGQQDTRSDLLGDLVSRLFEGSPALLVNSLLDQKGISEEEVQQIKTLVSERSDHENDVK